MNAVPSYREPLAPTAKRALALLVVLFHVGLGWALTTISPQKLIVGDVSAMEIRMVSADPAPQADPVLGSAAESAPSEYPRPPELDMPKEPGRSAFPPPADLASVVEPPPPDLPPPEFPLEVPPPQPPPEEKQAVKPTPPPPPEEKRVAKPTPPQPPEEKKEAKPTPPPTPPRPPERPKVPAPPRPAQALPNAAPAEMAARPAPSTAPKTVSASQVAYLKPPSTEYPARSRRAGEQGRVRLMVLVDTAGRPAQVNLQTSSGFPSLDQAAVNAVRAALFRPYSEGGVAQAVWVVVPIDFVLR